MDRIVFNTSSLFWIALLLLLSLLHLDVPCPDTFEDMSAQRSACTSRVEWWSRARFSSVNLQWHA